MRIIFFGTLAFVLWSIFGNYWYVCKIRGLCDEADRQMAFIDPVESTDSTPSDSSVLFRSGVEGKTMDTIPEVEAFETVYVRFALGSDSIINTAELLPAIAKLKQQIEIEEAATILLVGHTDDQGEADFNYLLGLQRAQSFKRLLIAEKIEPDLLHVASRGEKDPLVANTTEVNREKNRRVEILIF
ncbi:MAG: OmpA family protein [Bacteroidota bacterium]